MALRGPILLIEDDENDADVITTAIKELGIPNEVRLFPKAQAAHQYLLETTDKPLVLLCDVRMPGQDGLSLLRQIQANGYLRLKAVPFVFLSGVVMPDVIDEAFNIGVQGFYVKPSSYVALKDIIRTIVTYWMGSAHPSTRYSDLHEQKKQVVEK